MTTPMINLSFGWLPEVVFVAEQEHEDQIEVPCFDCGGDGGWEVVTGYSSRDGQPTGYWATCPSCEGRGGGWIDTQPRTLDDLDDIDAEDLMTEKGTPMTRYILIDNNSGFIWGDLEAETPIDACKATDAVGNIQRDYYQYGPRNQARLEHDGYYVYEAPADFPEITNGQDQEQILKVDAMLNCVAFVATQESENN